MVKVVILGKEKSSKLHQEAWDRIAESDGTVQTGNTAVLQEAVEAGTDLIDVCLPVDQRADYIRSAAKRGLDVICEGPIAWNAAEVRSAEAECRKAGTSLHVLGSRRSEPAYADAKKQLDSQMLGVPGVIRLASSAERPAGNPDLFYQAGIKEFDFLLWLLGDVERVMTHYIRRERKDGSKLEFAMITLRMENGAIAHVELSWAQEKPDASFELTGTLGMLTYSSRVSSPIIAEGVNGSLELEEGLLVKKPLQRELEAIISGKPLFTSQDALKAMQVAEAAKESAEIGQPVTIERGVVK